MKNIETRENRYFGYTDDEFVTVEKYGHALKKIKKKLGVKKKKPRAAGFYYQQLKRPQGQGIRKNHPDSDLIVSGQNLGDAIQLGGGCEKLDGTWTVGGDPGAADTEITVIDGQWNTISGEDRELECDGPGVWFLGGDLDLHIMINKTIVPDGENKLIETVRWLRPPPYGNTTWVREIELFDALPPAPAAPPAVAAPAPPAPAPPAAVAAAAAHAPPPPAAAAAAAAPAPPAAVAAAAAAAAAAAHAPPPPAAAGRVLAPEDALRIFDDQQQINLAPFLHLGTTLTDNRYSRWRCGCRTPPCIPRQTQTEWTNELGNVPPTILELGRLDNIFDTNEQRRIDLGYDDAETVFANELKDSVIALLGGMEHTGVVWACTDSLRNIRDAISEVRAKRVGDVYPDWKVFILYLWTETDFYRLITEFGAFLFKVLPTHHASWMGNVSDGQDALNHPLYTHYLNIYKAYRIALTKNIYITYPNILPDQVSPVIFRGQSYHSSYQAEVSWENTQGGGLVAHSPMSWSSSLGGAQNFMFGAIGGGGCILVTDQVEYGKAINSISRYPNESEHLIRGGLIYKNMVEFVCPAFPDIPDVQRGAARWNEFCERVSNEQTVVLRRPLPLDEINELREGARLIYIQFEDYPDDLDEIHPPGGGGHHKNKKSLKSKKALYSKKKKKVKKKKTKKKLNLSDISQYKFSMSSSNGTLKKRSKRNKKSKRSKRKKRSKR
jgi:hypothetical protein